jgi:subtilisin family serine protease
VLLLPPGASLAAAEAAGYRILQAAQATILGGTLFRLGLPPGRSTAEAQSELGTLVPGALADVNHGYRPDSFPCTAAGCAAHEAIGWSGWPSAMAPRIGMIDTGINTDHDALAGARLTVIQAELAERDVAGRQHGTAIAAMLVGGIGSRAPGLLPLAELVAIEAFHRDAAGDVADAFGLAVALDRLAREAVSVINLSFSGPENAVLGAAVRQVSAAGIGLVAAAGNGGPGADPAYPAAWPEVLAVTAVDAGLRAYRQANQGPYITLAAPGVNVWTAASISGGRPRSGTSYAAPFVTATLAVQRMRAPLATLDETVAAMIGCARDLGEAGFDPVFGHGLVSSPTQCRGEAGLFSVSGE